MTSARPARRFQFTLRRMLATLTWGSLLFAICVGQQQAAVRQRVHLEHLKAMGILPRWQPLGVRPGGPAPSRSAKPASRTDNASAENGAETDDGNPQGLRTH